MNFYKKLSTCKSYFISPPRPLSGWLSAAAHYNALYFYGGKRGGGAGRGEKRSPERPGFYKEY